MSFIAKNPLIIPEVESSPSVPQAGTRGIFAGRTGWHDIDSNNKTRKFVMEDEVENFVSPIVYATPSAGLEIEGGIVVGIGSCRDEHIVIPEVDGSGNEVYAVADNVFGNLLDDGDFIKSITFPPSIKRFENEHGRLDSSVIYGDYCANLESVYILNPNIEWIGTTPLKLPGATKNVYFGGTRKQWSELNKDRYLIQLKDENIAAGIVPTLHYSYFLPYGNTYTKEEVEGRFVNWHEQLLHKIYHNEINTTRTLRTDIVYLYKAESLEGVVYDDVPFRTATIFNSQPFSVSLGLPTIVQTAIANDGQVYVRELSEKRWSDEYDFTIPWVCKTYTKEEVDAEFDKMEIAWDVLSKNKASKSEVYTRSEIDGTIGSLEENKADKTFVEEKITALVDGAPEALDTLKEIAEALKNNDDVATELVELISARYTKAETDEKIKAGDDAVYDALNEELNNLTASQMPFKTEDVDLTKVTTYSSTDGSPYVNPKRLGNDFNATEFMVNVKGFVRFKGICESMSYEGVRVTVDGKTTVERNENDEITYEGKVNECIYITCAWGGINFSEFINELSVEEALEDRYTKTDVDSIIETHTEDMFNEVDAKLAPINSNIGEINNKLEELSQSKNISLTDITTAVPDTEDDECTVTDTYVSSSFGTFNIDIQGNVKLKCHIEEGDATISIDGKTVAQLNFYENNTEYTFEGVINEGMSVHCTMAALYFTEFIKKVHIMDSVLGLEEQVGSIDTALDAILAIQESIVGGVE